MIVKRSYISTLDPHEAIEEVELPAGVGSRAPVSPAYLVRFFSEAGVLSDLILYMRRQRAVLIGLENDACTGRTFNIQYIHTNAIKYEQ